MRFHMKRKVILWTVIGCILAVTAIGAKLQIIETFQRDKIHHDKNITTYGITIDFDPVERIITGNEKVQYTNQSNTAFNALYFHLYPNTFKTKDTVPFEKNEMDLAYPNGFEEGNIQIQDIQNNNEPLNHVVMGIGDTVLKVNLKNPLEPGKKIELDIKFSVKIPPSYGRFGYGEHTVNIANWYPILAVFDKKGWNLEPYYSIGDPFYSDVANYRVEVSTSNEYVFAHTGECVKREKVDGKTRWTLEAKCVRDFAMVGSENYKSMDDEINGVKVFSYYFNDPFGDLSLSAAKDAIKIFSELYGKYPYKQFSVAASDFFIGGMEYPNLVFIDQSLYKDEYKEILEYIVVHEAAHQWWYGIVGNDEVNEPWLDEALTEYSTILYYEKKYGKERMDKVYKNLIARPYHEYASIHSDNKKGICRSINKFENAHEYQALVYNKGAMFIKELREKLGDEVFFKAMKVYFDKYKYKNADTEKFIQVCEKVSNQSLRGEFKKWLRYEKE